MQHESSTSNDGDAPDAGVSGSADGNGGCSYLPVSEHLVGPRALEVLAPGRAVEQKLCVVLSQVAAVDAAGGLAVGVAARRHREHREGFSVELWEPRAWPAWELIHDLLGPGPGPLPPNVSWVGDQDKPARVRSVMIPVTEVANIDAASLIADHALAAAAAAAGVSQRTVPLLRAFFSELADNAFRNAPDGTAPLTCVASDAQRGQVTLAMWNDGLGLSAFESRGDVERIFAGDGSSLRGLDSTAALGAAMGIDVAIEIASGEVRVTRIAGRWNVSSGAAVVGFMITITLQRS